LRAPDFWSRAASPLASLLAPLGLAYGAAGRLRETLTTPRRLPVPVICVGNATAGGAGKTPVALALAAFLQARGRAPHFLSRGYGGGAGSGPLRVDAEGQDFRAVGDEALLLARQAPCWIGADRRAGARAAIAAGAELLVMDDGLQNPSLAKDFSLLVIDGPYGIGNGRLIPAGPLREPLARALARVQAAAIVGEDAHRLGERLAARIPVLRAELVARDSAAWRGRRVLAFAGIGRPAKFFATLEALGCELVARRAFPDHHPYTEDEAMRLVEAASAERATPVTTEKDFVRLPPEARRMVEALPVAIQWRDERTLAALLAPLLARAPSAARG
jgi:tetraacyldisaccharide 4'-kinase